jgi:hypothetical protein
LSAGVGALNPCANAVGRGDSAALLDMARC